jgi:hypothetical protein
MHSLRYKIVKLLRRMAGFVEPGEEYFVPQIMHIPLRRVIAYVTIVPVGIISLSVQGSLLK